MRLWSSKLDSRPIQTRFRCGSACHWLNLATKSNSPAHSPRGTPSDLPRGHCPSTACKHAVSGSFNSPHRGAFHLSLTVLVHYRSSRVFSLGKWTSRFPAGLACPAVLKDSSRSLEFFRLRGYHSLCLGIPTHSTRNQICNSSGPRQRTPPRLTTPIMQRLSPITHNGFELFPFRSPLLRE